MMKRGEITTRNVATLVIAVIGLALISIAIIRFFDIGLSGDDNRAQETLDSIEGKINNLKVGDVGGFNFRGVDGWFLAGWGKEGVGRPDKCFFNSCVCVCKGDAKELGNECQNSGFCRALDLDEVDINGKILEETFVPPAGDPKGGAGKGDYVSKEVPHISLDDDLVRLYIGKGVDKLIVRVEEFDISDEYGDTR